MTGQGDAPQNQQDALRVLRVEARIRLSKEYLEKTAPYVLSYRTPPIEFDKDAQKQALAECGFG